jgi:hypothetical protein
LEDNISKGRIAPQVKYDIKPLLFGQHELQTAASASADLKIQALIGPFQKACQDEMLNGRKSLRTNIDVFDIKESCEKLAQDKYVTLCGGDRSTNYYDRNYAVMHEMEATQTEIEGGSGGSIQMQITLSSAIISAAFHKSGLLAATTEAADALKIAESKKAKEEAQAKLSAAEAAAAIRPSAESEEAIRKRLTKEITAQCMQDLRKEIQAGQLNLNHHAVQSQSSQRGGTANRGQGRGRGRGRGNPGQVNAGGQQTTRGRGRGLGRGSQLPAQETHQAASNSRSRQPSRSPSRHRGVFQSPPPPLTPRASSSSPRQTPSGSRGKTRGGGGSTPRAPSPAATRGGRGRGRAMRGRSPSLRR